MRETQTSSSDCYLAFYLRNLVAESTVGPVNSAAIQCVPAAVQPGSRAAWHRARLVPRDRTLYELSSMADVVLSFHRSLHRLPVMVDLVVTNRPALSGVCTRIDRICTRGKQHSLALCL